MLDFSNVTGTSRRGRTPIGIILIVWAGTAWGQDAAELVRKSTEHDQQNFERLKNYTYQQRMETRSLDSKGKVTSAESKTNEVVILVGRPYDKLIAKDDKPLPEKEAKLEQEKLDKEFAKRSRLSAEEAAKLEKEREADRKYLREVPDAYDFRLLGQDTVSGKPAWIVQADPKASFKPRDSQAKVLSKVRAKFWIDKKDLQWVKMEAEVIDTIALGLSMVRIAPGGILSFEQTHVNDDVWLPARFSVKAGARLALLFNRQMEIDAIYSGYKKFQSDSRVVAAK